MSERSATLLEFLAAVAIGAAVVIVADRHSGRNAGPETRIITRVDTLVVRDTIRVSTPVPVAVRVVDTLYVPVEVEGGRDTVWAELPREAKVYQDSTYRAVVSGYLPSLDSMEVYRRTVTVNRTNTIFVEPGRWSVGIQAGYGASKDGLTPYVGVGVQYTLWRSKK